MPLYEYQCEDCGKRLELVQSVADMEREKNRLRCVCEGRLKKLVSVPAAIRGTYSDFWRDRDDGFRGNDKFRKRAYARARKAGVSTAGKTFIPQLCRDGVPFDPLAWVSDQSDVKARCAALNLSANGNVKHKARPIEQKPQPYRVAEHVVEQHVTQRIGRNYVPAKERRDLKETVAKELAGDMNKPGIDEKQLQTALAEL